MKKALALLAILIFLLTLAGCGYTSSYKAVALVHSNKAETAYMSFYEFTGTMVFKLKCKGQEEIRYAVKLEEGSAAVYYDCGGGKTELVAVRDGDETGGAAGSLQNGTVYVIVKTDGTCRNGDFRFELE